MFGLLESRPRSRAGELARALGALEPLLARIGEMTAGAPRDAARRVADRVGSRLDEMSDRLRTRAADASGTLDRQFDRLGQRASTMGREAYDAMRGTPQPLVLLGVAAGVGLLIGLGLYGSAALKPGARRIARQNGKSRSRRG
jgi:ElaB/YqjD/DUF883 family membrane-anchored ribosome-binding protein